MRLAVPVCAGGEARQLYEAGATELYCGLQDTAWAGRFGDHDSISRRQGAANLPTLSELRQVLAEATALGMPVMLTVNGSYGDAQLPMVLELCARWEDMGGQGLMLCDPGLLAALQSRSSGLLRGLSLLAAVSNPAALGFYHRLGVRRVVLPRFLSPREMGEVLAPYPDVEGEAMVWLDKCRYIDGLCRFLHSVGYADAPGQAPVDTRTAWDTTYRLPACWVLEGPPPTLPACAVCHLEALRENGIRIFKLGGRGRSLATRLEGIRFLREAAGIAEPEGRRVLYRERFGEPCGPPVCYYGGN